MIIFTSESKLRGMIAVLILGFTQLAISGLLAGEVVEIRNWHELSAINEDLRGSYILVNDLDEATAGYAEVAGPEANEGRGFRPLGRSYITLFRGTFDGGGYTISRLYIDRPKANYVALFGFLSSQAKVENVHLEAVVIRGKNEVGALAGENMGEIVNSSSTGNVAGRTLVGGLVGCNDGQLSFSHSTVNVNGQCCVGGLAGMNCRVIINSYASGSVAGEQHSVGGLVGHNGYHDSGQVENSFWNRDTAGVDRSAGGEGISMRAMQSQATFTEAGWDFATRWRIEEGGGYPRLQP